MLKRQSQSSQYWAWRFSRDSRQTRWQSRQRPRPSHSSKLRPSQACNCGTARRKSFPCTFLLSARTTKAGLLNANLYFSLSTDAQEVGGSSAGASAAVATAALLSGRKIKSGFIMTGSVDEQGKIGQVGRILEKARAAKKAGYTTFLVPPGESTVQIATEKCTERSVGNALVKNCDTQFEEKSVEDEAGIRVIEVGSASQAFALATETI